MRFVPIDLKRKGFLLSREVTLYLLLTVFRHYERPRVPP